MLTIQIGAALKIVPSCHNYSVTKAQQGKNTLLKFMRPVLSENQRPSQIVQELYWLYNYLTCQDPIYTASFLSQYREVLSFIFDDLNRDSTDDPHLCAIDLNPLIMALANIIDHSMADFGSDARSLQAAHTLSQAVHQITTNIQLFQRLLNQALGPKS